ncbi:MAG: hypothetical protein JWP03_1871 [Phycisphaerales bacterium]|nr:hypothetical protein [Phycisphaerales bacterium]
MSAKPPIPLGYHTPERRVGWAIHRGLPIVLALLLICGLIGWGIERRFRRTDRTDYQNVEYHYYVVAKHHP